MIQRKQTLWLAVVLVLLGLTFKFPMYVGTFNKVPEVYFPGNDNTGFRINTIILMIATTAAIFLYHARRIQTFVVSGTLLYWALIMYVSFFNHMSEYTSGSFTLWSVFYFAIPVFLILALRGIYKDEQLIKSVDRLR